MNCTVTVDRTDPRNRFEGDFTRYKGHNFEEACAEFLSLVQWEFTVELECVAANPNPGPPLFKTWSFDRTTRVLSFSDRLPNMVGHHHG